MPDIMDNDASMQQLKTPSNYVFSAVGFDKLLSSEYTLTTIVCDQSGSVSSFTRDIESCLKAINESCQPDCCPRADNLLSRLIVFNDSVREVHGFRPITEVSKDEYTGVISAGGGTALYDAIFQAVDATNAYGMKLIDKEYTANGVVYVITDGVDNSSRETIRTITAQMESVRKSEKLSSISVIVIMVGYAGATEKQELDKFVKDAGITQFIDLTELFKNSSPKKALAKLAGFISKSISSTSQALAHGTSTAASSQLVI